MIKLRVIFIFQVSEKMTKMDRRPKRICPEPREHSGRLLFIFPPVMNMSVTGASRILFKTIYSKGNPCCGISAHLLHGHP
jgi:hypothetical protein